MKKIATVCLLVFAGCVENNVESQDDLIISSEQKLTLVYNHLFAPINVDKIEINITNNQYESQQIIISDCYESQSETADLSIGTWESSINIFGDDGNIISSNNIEISIFEDSPTLIGLQYQQSSSEVGIVRIENESQNCILSSDFSVNPYDLNPVIQKDSNWNYNLIVGPTVQFIENKYFMWYSGNGATPFQVGLAYSDDGFEWQNEETNPILTIGSDGDFDSFNIRWPYVIYDKGVYKMWYAGSTNGNDWQVGYATSVDGISWDKYDQSPVFIPSDEDWESYSIRLGAIVLKDEIYHLWYDGSSDGFHTTSAIGYAQSTDGINWNRIGAGPTLRAGSEFFATHKVSVGDVHWINDGYFEMFYTGVNENNERSVGRAVSEDGLNWFHDPNNPIIPHSTENTWNEFSSASSTFIREGDNYQLWFSGEDGYGNWNIGVAEGVMVCE